MRIFLFIIFLSSCAGSVKYEITNFIKKNNRPIKVCSVFNVIPVHGFSVEEKETIKKSAEYWNQLLGKKVFLYDSLDLKNIIFVEDDDASGFFLRRANTIGVTYINADDFGCVESTIIAINKNKLKDKPCLMEAIVRHELGHFLGLGHYTGTDECNLMLPEIIDRKCKVLNVSEGQINYLKRNIKIK